MLPTLPLFLFGFLVVEFLLRPTLRAFLPTTIGNEAPMESVATYVPLGFLVNFTLLAPLITVEQALIWSGAYSLALLALAVIYPCVERLLMSSPCSYPRYIIKGLWIVAVFTAAAGISYGLRAQLTPALIAPLGTAIPALFGTWLGGLSLYDLTLLVLLYFFSVTGANDVVRWVLDGLNPADSATSRVALTSLSGTALGNIGDEESTAHAEVAAGRSQSADPAFEAVAKGDTEAVLRQRSGRIIGNIERVLVITLMLNGHVTAAGLTIAAKSIGRFEKLRGEEGEYYLIGTLLSLGIAIVGSLIVTGLVGPIFHYH